MKHARFGDLCKIQKGQKPERLTTIPSSNSIRFLQIEDLRGEGLPKYVESGTAEVFDQNAVYIAWDGANAGTVGHGLTGAIGSTLAAITFDLDIVAPAYFAFFLKNRQKYIRASSTGATIPHLNRDVLENLHIPLPPLPEQKRIAALLEKADRLRRLRRYAREMSEGFLQSVFREMFGDPVRNERGWDRVEVGEMGIVQTGNTPSREDSENYGNHLEWIKSDNIIDGKLYVERSREMLSEKGAAISRAVPSGSLLVTCIAGSLKSIGNAAITDRKVAFNQQINAITPNQDFDVHFLYALFRTAQWYVRENASDGMKHLLSKSKFEELVLVHPPIEQQKAFRNVTRRYEKLLSAVDEAERQAEHLFQTLLHQAFAEG